MGASTRNWPRGGRGFLSVEKRTFSRLSVWRPFEHVSVPKETKPAAEHCQAFLSTRCDVTPSRGSRMRVAGPSPAGSSVQRGQGISVQGVPGEKELYRVKLAFEAVEEGGGIRATGRV